MLVLAPAFKETGMTSLGEWQAWLSLTCWHSLKTGYHKVRCSWQQMRHQLPSWLKQRKHTWLITGRLRRVEMKNTGVQVEEVTPRGLCWRQEEAGRRTGKVGEMMVHEHLLCAIHPWVLHLLFPVILKVLWGDSMNHLQMANQHPGSEHSNSRQTPTWGL